MSTTSYMILDLMPNKAYTYQVIAREEKGILGVDYNRSPKAVFATKINMTDKTENIADVTPTIASSVVEFYTTNEPLMAKKIEYKGILHANILKNLRRKKVESQMSGMREELLLKLKEKAMEVGANAVVGMQMEATILVHGLEMVAIGTAVYFER